MLYEVITSCEAICVREKSLEHGLMRQQEYGIGNVYTDYAEFLQDDDIDIVYVAVINSLHFAFAITALEAGKHVICEKPFTSTIEELKKLAEVAKDKALFFRITSYNVCYTKLLRDAGSRRFYGDEAQARSFADTLAVLAGQGAAITEIDFTPLYQIADLLYEGAWVGERYAVIESLLKSKPEALLPVTREIIGRAEQFSSADVFRGLYRLRGLLRDAEAA